MYIYRGVQVDKCFHDLQTKKPYVYKYIYIITEESNLIQILLVILMDFPKIIVHGLGW